MGSTDVLDVSSSISCNVGVTFANFLSTGGKIIISTPDTVTVNVGGASVSSLLNLADFTATSVTYDSALRNLKVSQVNGPDLNYVFTGTLSNLKPIFTSDGDGGTLIAFAPNFYVSTNGVLKEVLPEIYVGPVQGLVYQLISNEVNPVISAPNTNSFIKLTSSNSSGKAVNGNGGTHVIDGGVGSTFITGGEGHSGSTFFLDGRASGISWSTITDFNLGSDQATIWGWEAGVSRISTSFADFNTGGAAGYTGLTLHFENLLPDDAVTGQTNSNLNSITLSGFNLADIGATSLEDLNAQISAGTNSHFIVGQTTDAYGDHGYLFLS
jgi:hypothetical protein